MDENKKKLKKDYNKNNSTKWENALLVKSVDHEATSQTNAI